ncbi:uncharacterized protein ACA1_094530 [Acanthamoeba castellanii str. Neff]|uniref:Uncharacterized protein n=1 Tax=Acanthamoeba castellanii (strain ATCC 30010 / Neff) TaxID=1257118 RepID=L8GJE5_ACACF|nr:uncharacterized protein ACA1_094530 [Acanthamoeba castellanii str. Neff]ELR12873.1 hypothetical protein ACA1_094530 [Acanthamoeba castellanii str. Neff]
MEGIRWRRMVCAWVDCPERAGMTTPLRETPSLSLQAAQGEAGVGYFLACGVCGGWVLPCESCGALKEGEEGSNDDACNERGEEGWAWCGKCGYPNILAPTARARHGLDPVPLWPITPTRTRAAQRAIGEGAHARTLVALLEVRAGVRRSLALKRKSSPSTTAVAGGYPKRHCIATDRHHPRTPPPPPPPPELPLGPRALHHPPNSTLGGDQKPAEEAEEDEKQQEQEQEEGQTDAEARAYGRLWAYADPAMRLRDNDVLRAYSPLHRLSRFTATHLQLLETLYADDLRLETGHARSLTGRTWVTCMMLVATAFQREPVLSSAAWRHPRLSRWGCGHWASWQLNQRADRSTWWQVNATLHQHLFTHKSQAISREEMVQVLLAHINVEVGRISMAAGATDHDKVVHAQSCIPIWLRAHQSLSSALECPQGVIYFGQKK